MSFTDIVAAAWHNTRARWLRTVLTGAGIAWGLALFLCLSAMGEGSRLHYRAKMEAVGRKVIYAFPGSMVGRSGSERSTRHVVLDIDDPARLPASPRVERAAAELWSGPRLLKANDRLKIVWTYGVAPQAEQIRNYRIARGRFVNQDDIVERKRVVILGARAAERVFGRREALGQYVRLDGHPFKVIGVSERKGMQMVNMGPMDDEQVLLPITTAQTLFTHSDTINYIIYDPRSREEGSDSMQRVRTILSRHHHFGPGDEQAVEFYNSWDMLRLTQAMGVALEIFLAACGLLTLAAGGVGVMNIMLVAVAERTRELALRKALGATRRDLFRQLLVETVLITFASGLVGLVLGALLVTGLRALPGDDFLVARPVLSPGIIALAFAVLVGTGIAAGIVPARRAARLDPAEGLREE